MLQTLFTIPRDLAGLPLVYWLFGVWVIASIVALVRLASLHGWSQAIRESWTTMLVTAVAIGFLPKLMETDGLSIRGYGVMLLLAVVSGVGLSVWRAKRIGFDPEIILSLAMWLFISGIVGARVFFVIEYWETFQRATLGETLKAMLSVTKGGLVVYGCMLAGGAALAVYVYKYRLPGLVLADIIAPGVVLGMAIGRLGCFLNGCCYGGACDLPWAVQFPYGSPPFMDQANKGELFLHGLRLKSSAAGPALIEAVAPRSAAETQGLKPGDQIDAINGAKVTSASEANLTLLEIYGAEKKIELQIAGKSKPVSWSVEALPRSNPVHPAQLYSSIDAFLLCLFLLAYDPYRRREGELTALTLTLHPISRFLLEIIRIDESAVFGTQMSISQNISIGVLLGAIVCWCIVLARPKGLWPEACRDSGTATR